MPRQSIKGHLSLIKQTVISKNQQHINEAENQLVAFFDVGYVANSPS